MIKTIDTENITTELIECAYMRFTAKPSKKDIQLLLEAAPTVEPAQRCNCCGYLVTESEHKGCLRAAQQDQTLLNTCLAFDKQEPAQAEDQSNSSIQLAKMIMSDCGVSDNCESLVNRIAGRIDAAQKQEPAQAVPVAYGIPNRCMRKRTQGSNPCFAAKFNGLRDSDHSQN